jgi:hypothetical protein
MDDDECTCDDCRRDAMAELVRLTESFGLYRIERAPQR